MNAANRALNHCMRIGDAFKRYWWSNWAGGSGPNKARQRQTDDTNKRYERGCSNRRSRGARDVTATSAATLTVKACLIQAAREVNIQATVWRSSNWRCKFRTGVHMAITLQTL